MRNDLDRGLILIGNVDQSKGTIVLRDNEELAAFGQRHAERVAVVVDALNGVLPAAACEPGANGQELVRIGTIGIYINGMADLIVDALDAADL